jgi:hypothetical protein
MAKLLTHKRNETGLPLSEIARITRIKESYLKAIEEEEFPKLPIEVYTRGYIREYAKFLGIPPEEALIPYERYLELHKAGSEKLRAKPARDVTQAPTNASPAFRSKDVTVNRSSSSESAKRPAFLVVLSHRRVAWILPAVLAVLIIYSALPSRKEVSRPAIKLEEPGTAKIDQPQGELPESAGGTTADRLTPQGPQLRDSLSGQAQPAPHRLDIVATDKVWLQVIIDGTEKRDMLLNPGDRVNYTATQSFALKIGNAAGLRLIFNQREFDNLGSKGQVISLSLPENESDPSVPKKQNLGNRIITPSEASQP